MMKAKMEAALELGALARSIVQLEEIETRRTDETDHLTPRPLTITMPGWPEPMNIPGSLAGPVVGAIADTLEELMAKSLETLAAS